MMTFAVTLSAGNGSLAQEYGSAKPIEPDMAAYFREQFDSIGATLASANVPAATCREVMLPPSASEQLQGVAASLNSCSIDLGCGETLEVPMWRMNGNLVFGPDNVETIVAINCPLAIPNPAKRAEIKRLVEEQMGVELQ